MTYFRKIDLLEQFCISSAESQKGTNVGQQCSAENHKGAFAIDFVWQ